MVSFIPGWGTQVPPPAGQQAQHSTFAETVIAVALGALAFLTASAFDRTNPGLAVLLRCVAGGIGLIWLFNRCCPNSNVHYPVHSHPVTPMPVYVSPAPPPTHSHTFWDLFSSPTMHTAPVNRPTGFSSVHKVPPHSHSMYQAPVSHDPVVHPIPPTFSKPSLQATTTYTNAPHVQPFPHTQPMHPQKMGGFPTVHKAQAQPVVHPIPPTFSKPPQQATTTYTSAPHVQPFPQPAKSTSGFPAVHKAPPQSTSSFPTTSGFPTVHKVPPQSTSGFPTVHKAQAQPDPHPMFQASVTRGPTVSSFPSMQPVSTPGGFPSVTKAQPGSHPGNQSHMFPAAKNRH